VQTQTIGKAPWMEWPETKAVIAALEAKGRPGCARFVGGCVRNTLMGKPVDDIDIATTLTPDQVIEALGEAGLKAIPTGVDHGTVTAVAKKIPFEITTLRRDVSTDGRRAVVAFTHAWEEDAQRRDFRFNALYVDGEGRLYDPTGHGVQDAKDGKVVFVGEPMTRIREDYLRILRFFRFQAWYGKGEPDQKALAACKALKGLVSGRAAERTQKEILKLLAADDPRPALRLMAATGVLAAILPFVKSLARLDGLVAIETEQLFENDVELRLAALIPDDVALARELAERLRLSNALKERLAEAVGTSPRIVSWMTARGPPGRLRPWPAHLHRPGEAGLGRLDPPGHHPAVARPAGAGRDLGSAVLPADRRGSDARRRRQGAAGRRGDARGGDLVDRPGLHRRQAVGDRAPEGGGPGHGGLTKPPPVGEVIA